MHIALATYEFLHPGVYILKKNYQHLAELGTRHDQVFRLTELLIIGIALLLYLLRQRSPNIFRIYSMPVTEALLRCRIVIVAKLKQCREPSSDI